MKKLLSIILAAALVLSIGAAALADDLVIATRLTTVTLRVEGKEDVVFYGDCAVPYKEALTVYDVLLALDSDDADEGDTPDFTFTDSGYGPYLSAVNGLAEFANASMDGWQTLINGVAPVVGISEQPVKERDEIVIYYSDAYGIGFQYPEIDDSKLVSDGIVSFTSLDTTYDENWNATTTRQPVAGATVVWNGATYTTDAAGAIRPATRKAAYNTVQISRYDEATGIPTVLRFAPGYVTRFADTVAGAWYDDAVRYCVENGLISGDGNRFRPSDKMSRADFAVVLYRLAGSPEATLQASAFPDVSDGAYYNAAVQWAAQNGIITGDGSGFNPRGNISRQDIAVILSRYLDYTDANIAVTAQYVIFPDEGDIADYAKNALQLLYKLGVITGTDGKINPRGSATRAEIAVVLERFSELV
jgi:hypothetical protein